MTMNLNEAVDIYQSDCGGRCSDGICDCPLIPEAKIGLSRISICTMFDIILDTLDKEDKK